MSSNNQILLETLESYENILKDDKVDIATVMNIFEATRMFFNPDVNQLNKMIEEGKNHFIELNDEERKDTEAIIGSANYKKLVEIHERFCALLRKTKKNLNELEADCDKVTDNIKACNDILEPKQHIYLDDEEVKAVGTYLSDINAWIKADSIKILMDEWKLFANHCQNLRQIILNYVPKWEKLKKFCVALAIFGGSALVICAVVCACLSPTTALAAFGGVFVLAYSGGFGSLFGTVMGSFASVGTICGLVGLVGVGGYALSRQFTEKDATMVNIKLQHIHELLNQILSFEKIMNETLEDTQIAAQNAVNVFSKLKLADKMIRKQTANSLDKINKSVQNLTKQVKATQKVIDQSLRQMLQHRLGK